MVGGLVLCALHAKVMDKVMDRGAGATCAWPACAQTAIFVALCHYHRKVAKGLLDPYRS